MWASEGIKRLNNPDASPAYVKPRGPWPQDPTEPLKSIIRDLSDELYKPLPPCHLCRVAAFEAADLDSRPAKPFVRVLCERIMEEPGKVAESDLRAVIGWAMACRGLGYANDSLTGVEDLGDKDYWNWDRYEVLVDGETHVRKFASRTAKKGEEQVTGGDKGTSTSTVGEKEENLTFPGHPINLACPGCMENDMDPFSQKPEWPIPVAISRWTSGGRDVTTWG